MKSFRLLPIVTTFVFLFAILVSTATAGSMGNGAAQRQKLVIDAIDTTAGTVEFKSMVDNSTHTYKIDATTRIAVYPKSTAGGKATIDQLKVGQKVANFATKEGQPPQTLSMLMVSEAPPASTTAPVAPTP